MGLKDGLGGEEIQTGSEANMYTQHAYVTGSVTAANVNVLGSIACVGVVSGAANATFPNIITTTASKIPLISGNVVAIAGSVVAAGKTLSPIGAGSPTNTWGQWIQAGSNQTGAGSNVWVVFPTAFTVQPKAVLASSAETNEALLVKAWGVGSFNIETTGASKDFTWIAVGL